MMKSMLSVAAALLVLAACTNDHEPGYAPAKEIRVDASIGQMTMPGWVQPTMHSSLWWTIPSTP